MAGDLPRVGDRVVVTVRHPFAIVVQGVLKAIWAFEGELVNTSEQFVVFRSMRLFSRTMAKNSLTSAPNIETYAMRIDVTIATSNIAGLVPMPERAEAKKP